MSHEPNPQPNPEAYEKRGAAEWITVGLAAVDTAATIYGVTKPPPPPPPPPEPDPPRVILPPGVDAD